MSWTVALIIALVLGVIVSNLLLLKQSAKHKLPSLKDKQQQGNNPDWDKDD